MKIAAVTATNSSADQILYASVEVRTGRDLWAWRGFSDGTLAGNIYVIFSSGKTGRGEADVLGADFTDATVAVGLACGVGMEANLKVSPAGAEGVLVPSEMEIL